MNSPHSATDTWDLRQFLPFGSWFPIYVHWRWRNKSFPHHFLFIEIRVDGIDAPGWKEALEGPRGTHLSIQPALPTRCIQFYPTVVASWSLGRLENIDGGTMKRRGLHFRSHEDSSSMLGTGLLGYHHSVSNPNKLMIVSLGWTLNCTLLCCEDHKRG